MRALVRPAVLLVGDQASAADIVQEVYSRLQRRRKAGSQPDDLPAYARASVLNACRNLLRRRALMDRLTERPTPVWSAESEVLLADDPRRVLEARARLAPRQREAIILRYYLDLREAEIAAATVTVTVTAENLRTLRAPATVRVIRRRWLVPAVIAVAVAMVAAVLVTGRPAAKAPERAPVPAPVPVRLSLAANAGVRYYVGGAKWGGAPVSVYDGGTGRRIAPVHAPRGVKGFWQVAGAGDNKTFQPPGDQTFAVAPKQRDGVRHPELRRDHRRSAERRER